MIILIIFVFSLLLFLGILYNFVQYKKDDESARIYGIFSFIAYIVLIISAVRIIPIGAFESEFSVRLFMIAVMLSVIAAAFIFLRKFGRSNMRGMVLITALCMAVMILPLKDNIVYQVNEANMDSEAMQEVYDRLYIASDYAEKKLVNDLNVDRDKITKTASGFVPSEEVEYFVSFSWNDDSGKENKFGYKISVNDEHECEVLESGDNVGADYL